MKKADLVEAVSEKAEISKTDANKAVTALFEVMTEALADGEKVPIVGFGTFKVTERKAREGHNPRTGEKLVIEARKAVTFKPGQALKDAVNE